MDIRPFVFATVTILETVEGGFRVARVYQHESSYWADTNRPEKTYYFLAVKA